MSDPLLPDGWTDLEPLVDEILDAPASQREEVLARLSGGDAARLEQLRSLLEECERKLPLLEAPAPEQFSQLVHDVADPILPEFLNDRYRIERELGHGGMARVFLALDTKHNRQVAVKVIRPELAASLGRERFLREIAIAARLRHPNIVPLYDSGDAGGVLYFVMPYEKGSSLRQRLDQGVALPASEYVSILRDVARALAYAHDEGVVHRDVKPDNVMLSGGAAVVTDFGIAKAVSVAQGGSVSTTTLTQSGSGIGTPTYMAPEQAIGDPATDHRADIYSFGCLAYELISGKPPFHDMPMHQLVAAHVATAPVPISDLAPEVPHAIAQVVMQCLAKEPVDRPQTAESLLDAFESSTLMAPPVPALHAQPPLVLPAAASAGWPNRVRGFAAVVAAMALAIVGYLFFRPSVAAAATEVTVAVLPMTSIGGDADLASGLSDQVAFELFRVPGVRVMSRLGVARYRGQRDIDAKRVGEETGARYLVMGSYRELSGRIRVLAKLIDATTGAMLWDDQFDRESKDFEAVRGEIAEAVGKVLRQRLAPVVAARALAPSVPRSRNPEAYRLYVLAQRALERRGQSLRSSIENFTQAIALDSSYADAWAGLSLARVLSPFMGGGITAPVIEPAVRAAATRALALDSTLAAPHVALGVAHQNAYRWDSATTEFQTAVRLRTAGDVEPLIQYGRHLLFRGRITDAIRQLMLARQTEPTSAVVSTWLGMAYYWNGQLDSALVEIRHAYQSDSTYRVLVGNGPVILQQAGLRVEARRRAETAGPEDDTRAMVLAEQGDSAAAFALVQRPENANEFTVMLAVGDTTAALVALERLTDTRDPWPAAHSVVDPKFKLLWPSARFRALLRRVGLGDVVLPAPRKN